ncbi:MAG: hypothetical protein WD382_04235, partial [Halofilum sp. (in: g-proteobacteria)]
MPRPRDARLPATIVGAAYAGAYLFALGDLDLLPDSAWEIRSGDMALARWFAMRSPFHFEAIALVDLGRLTVLISPINMAVAVVLGALLALNIHGAIELRRRPAQCRTMTGPLAGAAPALLAGGACCAPSLILLLGIPSLSVFAG